MRSKHMIIVAAMAGITSAAFAQPTEDARQFTLREPIDATALVGLPTMTMTARPGAPARELRIYIDYFRHEPSFALRIVDSSGVVRGQRVIWWGGKYSGYGQPIAHGRPGIGFPIDPKQYAAERAWVLRRFPCDSVRVTLVVEACRLSDYPDGSAPHLLAALDSLGAPSLPWNQNAAPDGGMLMVESWDGHAYRWYFYWSPGAKSPDPSVRAAAEITRRVWAIFERR